MKEYQVIARKYRPQRFSDVVGQDAIVTTLRNMIRSGKIAHAFLFCGSRGTGKTTLARLFAKALNCSNPTEELEPCNECASCREITGGHSMDILEIDGASNRGIEDIRKINETVGYSAASGQYKIYIIDEVHMLTKEAFNALLKTLEEPPPKVKFFFATTEPHKVLPTILSRCQRFNLNRISNDAIVTTLQKISGDLKVTVNEEALRLIASMADGGLRDAESLFDQVLAFHDGDVTVEAISAVLGVMPRDIYFDLDRAGKEENFAAAFDIVETVFSEGKDLLHFVEGLIEHFRNILVTKLSGKDSTLLSLSERDRERYEESAKLYRRDQCMQLLNDLVKAQEQIRFSPCSRIALEAVLLNVLRSHHRLPVDHLVKELIELEKKLADTPESVAEAPQTKVPASKVEAKREPVPRAPAAAVAAPPKVEPRPAAKSPAKAPSAAPAKAAEDVANVEDVIKQQRRFDTVLQFASVELGGTLEKKSNPSRA